MMSLTPLALVLLMYYTVIKVTLERLDLKDLKVIKVIKVILDRKGCRVFKAYKDSRESKDRGENKALQVQLVQQARKD